MRLRDGFAKRIAEEVRPHLHGLWNRCVAMAAGIVPADLLDRLLGILLAVGNLRSSLLLSLLLAKLVYAWRLHFTCSHFSLCWSVVVRLSLIHISEPTRPY